MAQEGAGIRVDVEWEGLEELFRMFEAYEEQVPKNVSDTYAGLTGSAKSVMDSLTPVETGFLKSRNSVRPEPNGITIENDAKYADFVNKGTRYQAPKPFFDQTVEFVRRELDRRLPQALDI